jgi:hypothetical protein
MKCNSTLRTLFALIFALTFNTLANSQAVYVDNGTSTNYNLASGDSLYIKSGTYTGSINKFDKDAKITVAAGATFQPGNISNPRGTLRNLGSVKMNGWFSTNGGFTVDNYGSMWFASGMSFNQGVQNWTNYYGGIMKFDMGVTINNNCVLLNRGTITSLGDITINSGASFYNNNTVNITGNFASNNSQFNNGGKFNVSGSFTLNGSTSFMNTCRLVIENGFTSNSQLVFNLGLIWCSVTKGNSKITINSSGTISNNGTIKTVDLTNHGTIDGSGSWYLTGYTYNTGTVGVTGSTSDTVKIYDVTRTSTSTIFDLQNKTPKPNTIYTVLSAPDTVNLQPTCSPEVLTNITLPVKWEYFYVNLSDNIPVLTWAAEQDPGTVFTVQRSYDAVNFTTIASIDGEEGKKVYKFEDKQVNTQTKSVYYRIRAIEPTGAITISDTRTLMFTTKAGVSVQATPNPFTSQLNISYQSLNRERINIRIISMSGAVMASKAVNVSAGYNSIAITEAASLIKGIYLVQLISENTVIATERVVKQ